MIEPSGARAAVAQPIKHNVIEQFVVGKAITGIAFTIGPGAEFLIDPGRLPGERIRQAITQRLRSGPLDFRIGAVVGHVPAHLRHYRLFVLVQVQHLVRSRLPRRKVEMDRLETFSALQAAPKRRSI